MHAGNGALHHCTLIDVTRPLRQVAHRPPAAWTPRRSVNQISYTVASHPCHRSVLGKTLLHCGT